MLTDLAASKTEVRVNEELSLRFSAKDENSRIKFSLAAWFTTSHFVCNNPFGNIRLLQTSAGAFELAGIKVDRPENLPEDRVVTLTGLGGTDNAMNFAQLRQQDPADEFYTDATTGQLTRIRVIRLKVREQVGYLRDSSPYLEVRPNRS